MRSMIGVGKDHVGASRPGCAPHSPPPVRWSAGDFFGCFALPVSVPRAMLAVDIDAEVAAEHFGDIGIGKRPMLATQVADQTRVSVRADEATAKLAKDVLGA